MKKLIALLLVVVMSLSVIGCGKDDAATESAGLPSNINELGNEYDVIDDMPDWTGDKLDLKVWYGYSSNETYIGKKSTDDKFRDEIERVTGIRISETESFDNGGSTGDTKVAKMASTGNWPHIGMGLENSVADKLINAGQIYDLAEYIPKYMPNYMKILNSNEEFQRQWDAIQTNDGVYKLQRFSQTAFQYYDPEYTAEKYSNLIQPTDSRAYIWVRDDILKQIYPEAKTQAEIQQIYMEKGKFEQADMTDVTITSKENFRELLEKINALGIEENGKKVWPFYTHSGEDNWNLLTVFGGPLAGVGVPSGYVNYFTYYDGQKDEMVRTADQEWFKELCKFYQELVVDGLASKEALIDNKTAFEQKKQNGEYAILYGNVAPPTDEQLKAAGKNYSYRRVMVDVPVDQNTFVKSDNSRGVFDYYSMYLFKTLNETQVEQVLRFIDFFYSEAGMKFANWGPEKAGLYTVDENGNMRYTDKAFEQAQLYDGDQQVLIDYGILSFPRIDYFLCPDGLNKYQPELIYGDNKERVAADWRKQWNYSYFEPLPDYPYLTFRPIIYNFATFSEGATKFWNARQSSEDAVKKIFTASTDEEFEAFYSQMIEKLKANGLTDDTIKEMTQVVKDENGELYDDLANWTYE